MSKSLPQQIEPVLCECGQGDPAEHWICPECGEDWLDDCAGECVAESA